MSKSCLLILCFLYIISGAFATPDPTARIAGKLSTSDGKAAAFVNILIKNSNRGTSSDEQGNFLFEALEPGSYTLVFSATGFESKEMVVQASDDRKKTHTITLDISSKSLNTVVVTGQKRRISSATKSTVPLLDIPMSIQVIDQQILRQQAVIDLKDVVKNVSGINQTGSYNGGYQFFNSRGFDMNNWTNFRRNGTLLWNMGNHFADFYERIEFLKGPAAILYGDVAPGGVMNFVTKKPLDYEYKRFELKLGQYGLFRPAIDISGSLNEKGNLLYRLNASYEKARSFRDVVNNETIMLAPSITWNLSDKTSWNLEANYKLDKRVGDPGLVSPDGSFEGLRTLSEKTFLGEREATYTYRNNSFFSTINHRFNANWKLVQTTSYTQTQRTPLNVYLNNDADANGNITRYQYFFKQQFDTWTTQLDLIGEFQTGPIKHKVLVGGDWVDDKIRMGGFLSEDIAGSINLFQPQRGTANLKALPEAWETTASFTTRLGAYVQDQLSFWNEKLNLLAGLRFNKYVSGTRFDNPADKPADYSELKESPVVPRFGIVYKPIKNVSVYGSYAKSFEVNGPDWINPAILIPPTTGTQLEFGVKADLLQQKLGVTLAAFSLNKRDVYNWRYSATSPTDFEYISWTPDDGAYFTYLADQHRSQGLELDINGKITSNFNVLVSASLIKATIVDDVVYARGNWLANQPRQMFSTWAHYTFQRYVKGLSLGAGFYYKGKFYGDNENSSASLVPNNHTIDVSMGYTIKYLLLQLNVTNLTNRVSYLGGYGVWEPQWTRRAIFTIAYKF
jgi:iron complex outermembrane receptor protein